jgi:hypothetical protein
MTALTGATLVEIASGRAEVVAANLSRLAEG